MILHIIVSSPERNGGLYPAAIYFVYAIYNSNNNGVLIKYRNKPQFINQSHHCMLYILSLLCGDTIFYLISGRNQKFLFDEYDVFPKPNVTAVRTRLYKKTPWRRSVPEVFCRTTFFAKMDE